MTKYCQVKELSHGWSEWIAPVHKGYKLACCDCGLVHELQFKVVRQGSLNKDRSWKVLPTRMRKLRVFFRARRDNRATGQMRRSYKCRLVQTKINFKDAGL